MRSRRPRIATAGAASALLVAAVVGCGADPEEPGEPGGQASTSESSDETVTDSDDEESEGPDVEPAAGDEVTTDHLTLRVPEGWQVRQLTDDVQVAERRPLDGSSLTIYDFELPGDAVSLDVLARREARKAAVPPTPPPEVMDPVEVDGVELFHVGGRTNAAQYFDEYGPSVEGARVSLEFSLPTLTPRAERQEIIDSVLASVDWSL